MIVRMDFEKSDDLKSDKWDDEMLTEGNVVQESNGALVHENSSSTKTLFQYQPIHRNPVVYIFDLYLLRTLCVVNKNQRNWESGISPVRQHIGMPQGTGHLTYNHE